MKRFILTMGLAAAMMLFCAGSCNDNPEKPTPEDPEKSVSEAQATAYITTADSKRLFEEVSLEGGYSPSMAGKVVTIDKTKRYQEIDGFGAAITGSTCYNLLKMSQANRTAFLKEVFDPKEGLGSSLVRVSIGSSDFGLDEYTWCDTPGIENFAVHELDARDVIPVLKEIYAINPDVKIIASPWSCPRWMKRTLNNDQPYDKWTSGRVNPKYYDDYAAYFVKWIKTMEGEGFNIYAMTIQNEPLNNGNSMSTYMSWSEQRDFIKQSLGPAFKKAGIRTKILLFDHNYNYDNVASQKDYPLLILGDEQAAKYVAGSAWHNYGGDVSVLDKIHLSATDKDIYFTEASIGTWNYPSFEKALLGEYRLIFLETLKRWNKGVTLWNLVLDENGAPNRPGGCNTCYGAVEMNSVSTAITDRKSHYYYIAHASKVVKPGAVRIEASGYAPSGVTYIPFENSDGTIAVLILNESNSAQQIVFKAGQAVRCDIPARSLVSLLWKD